MIYFPHTPDQTPLTLTIAAVGITRSESLTWGGVQGGGGTGGATLTISMRRGEQQIAPEGIAFFADVSGFDVGAPVGEEVYDPRLHDIHYEWTFGDPGEYTAPVNVLAEWKNRNVAYGPFPAHIFSQPGTYTVVCTARHGAARRQFGLSPGRGDGRRSCPCLYRCDDHRGGLGRGVHGRRRARLDPGKSADRLRRRNGQGQDLEEQRRARGDFLQGRGTPSPARPVPMWARNTATFT